MSNCFHLSVANLENSLTGGPVLSCEFFETTFQLYVEMTYPSTTCKIYQNPKFKKLSTFITYTFTNIFIGFIPSKVINNNSIQTIAVFTIISTNYHGVVFENK